MCHCVVTSVEIDLNITSHGGMIDCNFNVKV